jgi:hypothetical protein
VAKVRQIFGFWYALYLIGVLFLLTLARMNDGSLLILSFDGDAVHMAQIVLRMADGQVPHQDFLTPLGVMAFLPIVWLVKLGAGVGAAFAYAPVLIGLFILPAIYWIGVSRLAPSGALAFGAVSLVSLMGLVHGGTDATVAVSMYYNNWCWAISGIIAVQVALPNPRRSLFANIIEPIFLGCCVGFLVLAKATFAVFLLPAILVALAMTKQFRLLGLGALVGVLFLIVFTVPFGLVGYWQGSVHDLLYVSQSAARAQPGDALSIMVWRPAQITGVLALIAGFVFLRQARLVVEPLVFLLLGAGWVLISHQNWQNDPHWLIVAGLILIGLSRDIIIYNRFGWPIQTALRTSAIVFFAAGLPLWMTQAQSLVVHSGLNSSKFSAALKNPHHDDLKFRRVQGGPYSVAVAHPALVAAPKEPTVFEGKTMSQCQKIDGLVAELVQTGVALDRFAQTHGTQVLYADWVNALWLFSSAEPLKGGAPWYYGGTAGFENAAYLVVPKCPMGQVVRGLVLNAITADDALTVDFVEETSLFLLYKFGG